MGWELAFIKALQSIANPLLDAFFRAVGELGGDVFWLAVIFLLFPLGRRKQALSLSVLLLSSFYLSYALKYAIMRPRPPPDLQRLGPRTDPSMPSTHSAEAVSNLGYVARELRRKWSYVACALLAILAGLSRVYFGLHWPTDVLAGLGLGLLVLSSYLLLAEKPLGKAIKARWELRVLFLPLPLALGVAAMLLTPPCWGRPSAYIGGLITGVFLGVLLPRQPSKRNPRDVVELLKALSSCAIGLVGLALAYLFLSGLLQFLGSALVGLWASWIGPYVLWARGRRAKKR